MFLDLARTVRILGNLLEQHLPGFTWTNNAETVNRILDAVNTEAHEASEGKTLNVSKCKNHEWNCDFDSSSLYHINHITDGKWGSFKSMFAELHNGKHISKSALLFNIFLVI